jgi:transcriptional regulator
MTTDGGQSAAYPPRAFRETRQDVLLDFIRRRPFGQFVTTGADGPLACGAPFLVREGPSGLELIAHLARANPQAMTPEAPALVIFQGPDAYVRPGWYETKALTGRAVPTWDYIVVQAKGRAQIIDDTSWLHDHLDALSAHQEQAFDDPWSPADAPADYIAQLTRGIVGLRVQVASLEGVWKLHQNHPRANRVGVVDGLTALGGDKAAAIAAAIVIDPPADREP